MERWKDGRMEGGKKGKKEGKGRMEGGNAREEG